MRHQYLGRDLRLQSARRFLVLTFLGSCVVTLVAFAVSAYTKLKFIEVLAFPVAALAMIGFWKLSKIASPYAASGDCTRELADERQSRVRDRALAYSFWVTSAWLCLGCLWMSIASSFNGAWMPRTYTDWSFVVWIVLVATATMPSLIIAWVEPDMPEPDAVVDVEDARIGSGVASKG